MRGGGGRRGGGPAHRRGPDVRGPGGGLRRAGGRVRPRGGPGPGRPGGGRARRDQRHGWPRRRDQRGDPQPAPLRPPSNHGARPPCAGSAVPHAGCAPCPGRRPRPPQITKTSPPLAPYPALAPGAPGPRRPPRWARPRAGPAPALGQAPRWTPALGPHAGPAPRCARSPLGPHAGPAPYAVPGPRHPTTSDNSKRRGEWPSRAPRPPVIRCNIWQITPHIDRDNHKEAITARGGGGTGGIRRPRGGPARRIRGPIRRGPAPAGARLPGPKDPPRPLRRGIMRLAGFLLSGPGWRRLP